MHHFAVVVVQYVVCCGIQYHYTTTTSIHAYCTVQQQKIKENMVTADFFLHYLL